MVELWLGLGNGYIGDFGESVSGDVDGNPIVSCVFIDNFILGLNGNKKN